MNKLQMIIITFLISLSICTLATTQVKATVSNIVLSPVGPVKMDVGQVQVFTATGSGGSGSLSYQWYLNDSPVGSDSSDYSFSSASSGSYSITVAITDISDFPVMSSPVSITVNALPTVNVSPVGPVMIDVGQIQVFSATASGGTGAIHYQWYLGGSIVSGATGSTYSFSGAIGSYSVTCKITDSASVPVTSSASNAVTVNVNAAPTVSVAPVGPVKMDVGQVQVFTATGSGGSGSLSYQWYLDGSAVGSNSVSYSYTAGGTSHSVTCKVTDSASSPVTSLASNAVSVTVNPALVAPTVSASLSTINQGQTSSLTSSSISTGTSPYTYQWLQKAPGVVPTRQLAVQLHQATPLSRRVLRLLEFGVLNLQITDAALAVVTSNAASVTVNVVPIVSMSPSSWTMDVGQSKTFTASASGGSGTYTSYHWYVGGVAQSGATASTFSYSPTSAGSYSITVTVTDSLGTTSALSSAASVTVAVLPTVSIVPVGPVKMDVGQVQVFTATGSGGSGSLSYQWFLDGSAVGSNSVSYSYTAGGTSHSVTCKVTDSASSPVTSLVSNAVSVTVNPALVAPTVSASLGTINQGQTSSLTSSSVSTGTSPYTYQWLQKAPGASSYSSISGATSSSYSFVTSGSTTAGAWSFELQVTDAASAVVTSNAASVTVNAVPIVSMSPSSWTMDVGQSKTFTASASGGSGTYTSYHWYVGGVAQSGATASTFSYSPASAGSYSITVTVTDSLGTTSALSSAASVTVAVSPTVSIVPVGPVKMDVGQVQVFTATGSGGSGSLSYQWYLDGSAVGSNSVSYSYTAGGTSHSVTCKVTDSASSPVTSLASNAVSVTVNPALVAPTVSAIFEYD